MITTQSNFFKPNSSKIKFNNIYNYDSFRPGNTNEFSKGKNSCSPNKVITQKEFFKNMKNNKNNNFNSYNTAYKFNDTVQNFFKKFPFRKNYQMK